jgi:hypothetical protein
MNMRSLFVALHKGVQKYRIGELTKASAVAALGVALFAPVAIAADKPADPKTWAGIGWGLGIAADFHLGGKRVTDAELVNGNTILRVKDTTQDVGVSFVLEAHYFVTDRFIGPLANLGGPGSCLKSKDPSPYTYGCTELASGPFVAVEIGGGSKATTDAGPITGYALGWMIGLHHPAMSDTSSWNFGVGFRIDPHAQTLGDGFVPNGPPPAGETAVRWKSETRYGLMLLSSFSF